MNLQAPYGTVTLKLFTLIIDHYPLLVASYLALHLLKQPLVLQSAATEPLRQLPAVQRIGELNFHQKERDAQSEWYKVLQDTEEPLQQQALAKLATEQGWHRMAIDAATRAKTWDALDVRFPMPYQDTFQHYGAVQKVPSTELMAIARRESAFHA